MVSHLSMQYYLSPNLKTVTVELRMDEGKHHGAVDKSLQTTGLVTDGKRLCCAKNGPIHLVPSGSYVSQAGMPSDEKLVVLEICEIRSLNSRCAFRHFESI